MSAPTSLFLLRHGEVEERFQHVFGGKLDMNLSPRGQAQAASLAGYLRSRAIHAVYASPMNRVQQTLRPFTAQFARPPVILADLREVDFGDWTGLNGDQVRVGFNANPSEWTSLLEQAAIPNAESAARLRARLEPCLEQMIRSHPGENIAVACHGGVIRMLLAILLELPFSKTGLMGVDYASLTLVERHPDKIRLRLLNFTPWRDRP